MLKTDSSETVAAYVDELLRDLVATPLPAEKAAPAAPIPVQAVSREAPVPTPPVGAPSGATAPTPMTAPKRTAEAVAPEGAPARAVLPATAERAAETGDGRRHRRASDRVDRWIGFQLAGQNFGVEVLSVLEVQRISEITPAPGAAADLMGAINLRGQIVPVMDLGQRLGFPPRAPTAASRMIVVDYKGQPVGLCVDGVSEVITARTSAVEPAPRLGGRIDQGWIRGVLRHKGETVLLLDPARLLADAEG